MRDWRKYIQNSQFFTHFARAHAYNNENLQLFNFICLVLHTFSFTTITVDTISSSQYKKEFVNIDLVALGLGSGKIFVNNNLTPINKELSFNCRKLKREQLISDTWSSNGYVKLRGNDDSVFSINHEIDLFRLFPNYSEFTFDTDFLANAEEFEEYLVYDGKDE